MISAQHWPKTAISSWRFTVVSIQIVSIRPFSLGALGFKNKEYSPKMFLMITRKLYTKRFRNFCAISLLEFVSKRLVSRRPKSPLDIPPLTSSFFFSFQVSVTRTQRHPSHGYFRYSLFICWPNDTEAPWDPQFKHVSDDRGSKPCERVLWIYVDGKASWKSISVFEVGDCEKYSETSQIVLKSQRQHFTINLFM